MALGISPNSLDTANTALSESLARLGSAKRINSAKDDAAGLAIAEAMSAQLSSDNQAIRNVYDGLSLTSTADSALGQATDSLQRMRELAVQAANGANNAADRQALQTEFNQLGQGLDQLANRTQFNGQKLLDGTFNGQAQAGPNPGDTQPLSIGNGTPQALGVAALEVTTPAKAANAIEALDNALVRVDRVSVDRGQTTV